MQWALDEIRKIQKAARSGKPIMKPRVSRLPLSPDGRTNFHSIVAGIDYAHTKGLEWTQESQWRIR
jgi:hypothetical protein